MAGHASQGGLGRALTAAAVTLLLIGLPAWIGGADLTAPAAPGELVRVAAGLQPDAGALPHSGPARAFYGMTLPAEPGQASPDKLLPRARLASVLGLLGISALLYVTVAFARRRTTALVACLAFAFLAPVAQDGAVLRPEVPAALFGGLAMLLVVGYPTLLLPRPRRVVWPAWLITAAAVGACIGLASACVPRAGAYLLVPGGALLLTVASLARTAVRVLRRRSWLRYPVRGVPRRAWPWLLLSLLSITVAVLVMAASVEGDSTGLLSTRSDAGLLPAHPVGAAVVAVLAAFGGLRLLFAVGMRFGRAHRVAADALLTVYAAVLLLQWAAGGRSYDALLVAPALAILVSEGAVALVLAVAVRLHLRGRR